MSTERTLSPAAQKMLDFCVARIDPAHLEGINLPRLCAVLAAAGARIVDQDAVEVKPDMWQAIVTIATGALSSPEAIQKLVWED